MNVWLPTIQTLKNLIPEHIKFWNIINFVKFYFKFFTLIVKFYNFFFFKKTNNLLSKFIKII